MIQERKRFIAIAGNMGVGKSALTQLLAERLGWTPYYEAVAENPYIADFYKDMNAWSFQSQVFFLSRRLKDHREILGHPTSVIQDRSIYEDAEIFARNLYLQGSMPERDWQTYWGLYRALCEVLSPPDLVIILQASVPTLVRRIALRGRDYEQQVSREYLEQLNRLYEEWADGFDLCPKLVISVDEMDFVKHSAHLEQISTWLIYKALPELFPSLPSLTKRRARIKKVEEQAGLPGVD